MGRKDRDPVENPMWKDEILGYEIIEEDMVSSADFVVKDDGDENVGVQIAEAMTMTLVI